MLTVVETTLELFEQNANLLKEGNILIRPDQYSENIASGEHKYFAAYANDALVGLSAMVRYRAPDNSIRIYHRAAYTVPGYRKTGVWRALMQAKVNYITKHNWSNDDTWHSASVAETDQRYKLMGWKEYLRNEQHTDNGVVPRVIWCNKWINIKEYFANV